ncbi:hypothetical protein CBR_g52385 [Chara braunii]|uniref:CCHC-type domain-containing protein n=1 Tax=Chara braunii TaxID=69332 RepID=A0A388MAF0_CHABU|nr:hypothetical protein CBR_g52385 [Chara braunii]|eukprot:GBG91429.1 hypothetical protein CBR_g52385 [Chara braunii]
MERWSSSHMGQRDPPQRFTHVCYECGEPGHYRNQCPKLGREGAPRYAGQQGRSVSPRHNARLPEPRAASEDPAIKRQIEDLAMSVATMKEVFDVEIAAKEEKRKKKQEKAERKKREEEEARAPEEARLAEQRCATRKEEKLRKEEEDRQLMRKELLMELSLRMGQLDESLQRRYKRDMRERVKGKQKIAEASSDEEEADPYESDVDTLSRQTEQVVITEKRKRGPEKAVGDSPPMVTPAKRTAKRRLQLGCRHRPMKRTSPRKTPVMRVSPGKTLGTGRRKIPAAPGTIGKVRFVTDNLRELGDMTVEELKRICLSEDVAYEGKKMQAILAIVEKRTQITIGNEEVKGPEEEIGENQAETEEVEEEEDGSDT